MAIAEGQWRDVALSDSEYCQILELLGREPSLVELGMFGAMWSEHCGYKHSRLLLKSLPSDAPWVLQGPGENAGAVDLGDGLAAVFKVESHNHPSAVEPYEGAATGVGGIVRDIFTMGARPIAILDGLRFGPLDDERNRYLFENVVAGIGGYGNCLGIPTVGGEIAFDGTYDGNPIVNAMCVGIVHKDRIVRAKASGAGNLVVLIGADTGRDGLHGATFASVDDPEASHRGVVQVGNPFLEKQLMEACLDLLQGDAVVAMQDLGAAGLTSSIVECASRGGVGVEIDVARVPRRESGMTPYEVMLSESQERMVLVAAPERFDEIVGVLDRWSLGSAMIGRITDDGIVRIRDGEEITVEVPVSLFIDECPAYAIESSRPAGHDTVTALDLADIPDVERLQVPAVLLQLLGSSNIGSRRGVWEQYDHTIQTNTVLGPGMGDAAVLRIKGTASAIAVSMDCNSRYCFVDPYIGAQHAILEACRNVSAVGGQPLGITNCLNFGNPERAPANWQLAKSVEGLGVACRELRIPIVSGNVSLYNESKQSPIHPTPMVGCVGKLDDVRHALPLAWRDGDDIYLLGNGRPVLGGSEYLAVIHGRIAGALPAVDYASERHVQQCLRRLAQMELCHAAHDVSNGGLAIALAEMAIASGIGAVIEPVRPTDRLDVTWFGESGSRVLVSAPRSSRKRITSVAGEHGAVLQFLGTVGGPDLALGTAGEAAVTDMRAAYERALSYSTNLGPEEIDYGDAPLHTPRWD